MNFEISGPLLQQSQVCERILRALPDWFGLEDAIQQYLYDVESLPTFVARSSGKVVGFLSIKLHNPYSAEIYVMGVLPERHGQGAGSALLSAAEAYLRQERVEFLQVKTLSEKHPDRGYARTRAFYRKKGFRPLEEFDHLWGAENPCLLMVKSLVQEKNPVEGGEADV